MLNPDTYPREDFGGTGPLLHLAVANGFPPGTYRALLALLTRTHCVFSLLPRALWSGSLPPTDYRDWRYSVLPDLSDGLRAHDAQHVVLVGHSLGAIASMLAVIDAPQRFRALVLLDPTILTPEQLAGLDSLRAADQLDRLPWAQRALRRRAQFESREAAFSYFRQKTLFEDWSDAVLWDYVESGTVGDAEGVTLRWSPAWEAYYFQTGFTGMWDVIPRLNALLPTLILRGDRSDTYLTESAAAVQALLPDVEHDTIKGGHLFPMTQPSATAARIAAFLQHH